MRLFACRNCRRPIYWSDETGWLHGVIPGYEREENTCERPGPVCEYSNCDHTSGPDPGCPCRCHLPPSRRPVVIDCRLCKGHRRWIGGGKDGHVDHLVHAAPSDYPPRWGSMLSNGTRSWYEIDHEASEGKEVVYRFVGFGCTFADAGEVRP